MATPAQRQFTLDDYWAVEQTSPLRHEFVHGAIFAMAGGTPRHNEVGANVLVAMRAALAGGPCRPVGSDQRIRVAEAEYTYADVSVYCERIEVAPGPPPDTATNPSVVVEVLSDSTRAYDHGDKRVMYQRIPSVREIWLVEPESVQVTVWRREGSAWTRHEHRDADAKVAVLGQPLPLRALYERTLT